MKNIVIVGGSYGGISTAHRILKHAGAGKCKITLIAPNSHHYWNMASPRGVIRGEIADEDLFRPIALGFQKYARNQFAFILATAESLDFEARRVGIRTSAGFSNIDYDYLILATGSRTPDNTPFKTLDSTESTRDALHDLQERLSRAKTIVVAGAGVSGVEICGEMGFAYGKEKEITLLASGQTILDTTPPNVSKLATKELENLNVKIRLQTKVLTSTKLADGRQELKLSGDGKLIADVYIPAFGLVPNSSYISEKHRNSKGFIMVDHYLRVKGVENAWAIGDVADIEAPQYKATDSQSAYLAKNMVLILSNKTPLPYQVASRPFVGFSIGKHTGTGYFGNMRIPSFVIAWARKTLFLERMEPMMDGSLF